MKRTKVMKCNYLFTSGDGHLTSDADVKNRSTHERDNNMQRVSDVVLLFSCLIIFTHMKLWIASARHNFKWVEIIYSICFLSMAGIVRGICSIFFVFVAGYTQAHTEPPTCTSQQFTCNNGYCVALEDKCNGLNNCEDHSDEADCVGEYSHLWGLKARLYHLEKWLVQPFNTLNTHDATKHNFATVKNYLTSYT